MSKKIVVTARAPEAETVRFYADNRPVVEMNIPVERLNNAAEKLQGAEQGSDRERRLREAFRSGYVEGRCEFLYRTKVTREWSRPKPIVVPALTVVAIIVALLKIILGG